MSRSSARPGRRPGNPDTRGAILAAARTRFAARGFTDTSVRAIAAEAAVDPAMVYHYFGTKQQLFLESASVRLPMPEIVAEITGGGRDGLGRRLVDAILRTWESDAQPALVTALRSMLADPAATRGIREFVTTELIGQVVRTLDVPQPESDRRAALVATQLLGLITARYLVALPVVVEQSPEQLAAAIGPVLQRYLDGDVDG